MKKKKMIQSILAIFATVFVLAGCASTRFAITLKPDPEMKAQQIADGVKFSIARLNVTQDKKSSGDIDIKASDLQAHAADVYPCLFGNDFADLPVSLDVRCESSEWSLFGLGLAVIPFPSCEECDCKVHTRVWGENGYVINETESIVLTECMWGTIFTPLGILPIPGKSDLRDTLFFPFYENPAAFIDNKKRLIMDSLTEVAARGIRQVDPARLKAAFESRKARLRQVDINGQAFWSFLGFGYSKSKCQPVVARLLLYREYPIRGVKPVEKVIVAQLEDGKWQPVTAYLRSIKKLTAAGVLLVDGRPSKVVIRKVDKPPLEDFIELPQKSTVDYIRWSNRILVEIKNSTLPRLTQEKNPEHLIKLVTRIEKAVLELNERAQMADSRVQQMVVEGKGADTTQSNELSVLCRQRIAIFKPILSALKQAVVARGR